MRVRPSIQSHGISSGFNSEFIWSGLKNYSQYLGLYANLEIWSTIGGFDCVIDFCTDLTRKAADLLSHSWSTEFLVDPSLCSTMICVKLPNKFIDFVLNEASLSSTDKLTYDQAEVVQNYLYFKHRIECPVKAIQNELYVRISAHIYNNLDDYKFLANKVLDCYKV